MLQSGNPLYALRLEPNLTPVIVISCQLLNVLSVANRSAINTTYDAHRKSGVRCKLLGDIPAPSNFCTAFYQDTHIPRKGEFS